MVCLIICLGWQSGGDHTVRIACLNFFRTLPISQVCERAIWPRLLEMVKLIATEDRYLFKTFLVRNTDLN